VKKYSAHEGGAVLLIGTKAGNLGLNITCATKVIMLEAEWNPDVCIYIIKQICNQLQYTNTVHRLLYKRILELTEWVKKVPR
jgi:SNF2 family DNA or RNA helicase